MSPKNPKVFETTFHTYTEYEVIGEGGSGRVYGVKDESGSIYALKHLDPSKATTEKRRRFQNELTFGRTNEHPNVISISDFGFLQDGNYKSPFFVMKRYRSSFRLLVDAGVDKKDVPTFLSQMLNGVEAAHLKGVIHRDIKPENILFDDATKSLLIADFGIAHFEEDDLYTAVETQAQARLANFQYAAPEQKVRGAKVDHRADIYALGLLLCEMFTKQVPQGTGFRTIGSVAPDFAFLDDVVTAMIQQEPSARPPSIQAIKDLINKRREQFLIDQRLSEVKKTVIPILEVDDPLALKAPELISADWNKGTLKLTLSVPVTEDWVYALHNAPNRSWNMNAPPESFRFSGDKAIVAADEHDAQSVIDHFKQWLPAATRYYKYLLETKFKGEAAVKARKLRQEQEEIEQRQRVLKNLKI